MVFDLIFYCVTVHTLYSGGKSLFFVLFDDVFVALQFISLLKRGGGDCIKKTTTLLACNKILKMSYPVLFIVDCEKSLSFPFFMDFSRTKRTASGESAGREDRGRELELRKFHRREDPGARMASACLSPFPLRFYL